MSGNIAFSGIVKNFFLPSNIPLGGLTSFSGYETVKFPNDTTATFCYGGTGLSTSTSWLGFGFGGDITSIIAIGQCQKPDDYLGGFLSLGLNYDTGAKGSKSLEVKASLNLGFNLETFNNILERHFSGATLHNREKISSNSRMKETALHLVHYAGGLASKKLKNGADYIIFKLLTLPFLIAADGDEISALEKEFTADDVQSFHKEKNLSTLKKDFTALLNAVIADPDFYTCTYNDTKYCEQIHIDTRQVLHALDESLGSCHSISVAAEATTSLNFKIPVKTKINAFFSYGFYGMHEVYQTTPGLSTSAIVANTFANHQWNDKTASCNGVEGTAGEQFGNLLKILRKY